MDRAATLREAILEQLRSREWRAGHRIPTERALSDQFGLSRSAVRRVLSDLKTRRLITQTVGSGTYVSQQVGEALASMSHAGGVSASSPAELMAARLAIEPGLVDLVVGNATPDDFARMDTCNDRAEAAASAEEFEYWDGLLHEAIAEAAHNAVVARVFHLMNQVRAQGEWGVLKRRSATPERRLEYQAEHRALVDALKQRDAPRARELCLAHLLHVRANLLGY